MPFFSILIPLYKNTEYLDDCLKSIFNQSFSNYEVIVCYQGDTDISSFVSNSKIKFIYLEKPSSYLARIEMYKYAKGNYVLYVDSDDELLPNALEILFETINSNLNVDIVQYKYTSNKKEVNLKKHNENKIIMNSKEYLNYFLSNYETFPIWRKCFKKMELDFYKEEIFMGDDALLSLSFINHAESVAIIEETLYYYRPNLNSGTNNLRPKHLNDICVFLKYSLPYRKNKDEIKMLIFSFFWTYITVYANNIGVDLSLNENVEYILNYIKSIHLKIKPNIFKKCFESALSKDKKFNKYYFILRLYFKIYSIKSFDIKIIN